MDFFTVEVLTWFGIIRYHVLFVIDIATRKVEIAGIVRDPHNGWMKQIAKNLTDPVDGFLKDTRYLIHDRDPLFTQAFKTILQGSGIEPVRLPRSSPNLNAYAERFVLSIKSECLDKIIPLGERHLRHTIREYMCHYHQERPHQGLESRLIHTTPGKIDPRSPVKKHPRLGGLLNFYSRSAAA